MSRIPLVALPVEVCDELIVSLLIRFGERGEGVDLAVVCGGVRVVHAFNVLNSPKKRKDIFLIFFRGSFVYSNSVPGQS